METYSTAPEALKFTTAEELEEKMDNILAWKNRNKYYENVYKLRELGAARCLELDQNIGAHLEALNTPFGSSERKLLEKWN